VDEVEGQDATGLPPGSVNATEASGAEVAGSAGKRRIANLHRGEPLPTPDFDDPLPDDFWLDDDERSVE
jgi:hypothetical protein